LAFLARRDPTLNALMIQEEIQSLLELLGINVLEQTLLGVEEAQRPVMRRKLAELTKSIRNPSEIDGIIQNLEARRQVKDIWESNQALGKKIEVLVKAVLESLRLEVDVHFRGYDLDAYLENLLVPEEDIGSIEIGATKIEIKATRSDGVSMSGIQAETATLDPAIYWLCVVALDPGDSLAAIDDAYVRARARFVPRIGEILSHPKSELGQAIEVARVSGIDLQHVDAIRYRVNRIVWESTGVNVADFVTIAVSEARSRLPRESTRQGR